MSGVFSEKMLHAKIWPNPADETLQINFDAPVSGKFEITGLSGIIFHSVILNESTQAEISMKDFANGFYILRILPVGEKAYNYKFLVIH